MHFMDFFLKCWAYWSPASEPTPWYPRRPPASAYPEGDRVPAEQRLWSRKIEPWRGEEEYGAQEASEEQ